jgi:serine/threonine protein kinase/TolB-like protein/Tfp pilus assembly protein PilF
MSESSLEPALSVSQLRFEHYEILTREDGTPFRLGSGAMGLTYKAIDVNLRRAVALKLISARFLGDESARRRFVREARAAASVRDSNVASVFHLGKSGDSYFYAMEFVDGEPLDKLIRHSGTLEVKLALEIMTQVASGLSAVHRQNLVHRDIKPSNIMVSLEGGGTTAKIIDLGLAKGVAESQSETAVSVPGSFAGTPEFASPEQFVGIGVDIRSDLYSLGATLWNMLTGQSPFRGTSAELMHQQLHAPLPIGQLGHVPQPVVALIEVLLEKDPARRFRNPGALLKTMPMIFEAIDVGWTISAQDLRQMALTDVASATHKSSTRRGPEKISVARLPSTASQVFGREQDIAFLDAAWSDPQVNVVTIVAWAGVGKSTLVNHWLRRIAAEHYRSAELVFGWSFYRQGTGGQSGSADEFLDAALTWFGDPNPRIGTVWEKGERLVRLVTHRRTLLVLDGLEPLQHPPGPQEGRLREPSLQTLLRELAAFNPGLCVITTRLPIADIADHEHGSARRLDLDQLSSDASVELLRALGVKGDEAELRRAGDEFSGHCLALTLLGSYLTDALDGDIRRREEVSKRLADDVRKGTHARAVMESYQTWLGEGPELSVLRILGLFDRPADAKAVGTLLKSPAIGGLTESLTDLSPTGWRTILAKLRRARLLAAEDPHNLGHLDAHPLVREFFGEQLRSERPDAWKECNRRLYHYYRTLTPQLPDSFREMEPLFLATVCGCNAGLFRDALHQVYIPRIQRGDASFSAKVLGARGALISVLAHFFEPGRWGSLVEATVDGQNLTAEDQVFVLMQAGLNLSATRGFSAPEARICYERAEPLCHTINDSSLLYLALVGQWRYSLLTDDLRVTLQIAKRIYSLAREKNDAAFLLGAYNALAGSHHYMGDFELARQYAVDGVQTWRQGGLQSPPEEVSAPAVTCLYFEALCEWHVGQIESSRATMAQAISLAKELNDSHALVLALYHSAILSVYERNPAEVERWASDVIEVSARRGFVSHLSGASVLRGWARSALGNTAEGISLIGAGIREYRAGGSILGLPFFLALKAEALHAAGRTPEALDAIKEADAVVEKSGSGRRHWSAELHRLRGVFLAGIGADETQIEKSFRAAIRTAKQQKSISLIARAEASFAEYRRQRGAGSDPLTISLPSAKGIEQSIAVLPFESLSDNRNDAYFADGVHDEILSNLAKVSQLKVISRTSVMTYRPGANRDLRSIADALGVANVVEGTVRRDGNRMRLTSKLIDARTDEIVWSETYDRYLTDIFAIQSEIAQTVASRLSAQLSPEERKDIEEKPTNNLEAYDLYLQAKQLLGPNTVVIILWRIEKETFSRAIHLLEEATQKDRNFALAYSMIAKAHDYLYSDQVDRTPERRALGDAAINEALRLRPDLAEVHLAAAFHLYTCYRDFERARVQIAIAARALSNSSDLLQLSAFIDRVQGRWEKATASLNRAVTLNPRNPELLFTLADTYRCRRRYRDNERILDRLIELEPDQPLFPLEKARSAFAEKADLNGIRAAHEALPTSMKDDVYITWERVYYAMCARDFAAAGESVSKNPNEEIRFFGPLVPRRIVALWLELVQGNHPTIEEFGAAREQLSRNVEADRTDPFMLAALALADVALGRKEESLQEARRAMEMRPISEDAEDGPCIAANVAVVYAWANQSDFAFEQLNILIKRTSYLLVTYGNLKTNPSWDPLRTDPRFEKLLAELAPKD